MESAKSILNRNVLRYCFALALVCMPTFLPTGIEAAEPAARNKSGNGTFVSYSGGLLTLNSSAGALIYDNVGANYKSYQNNEEGPGSKLVDTVHAFSGGKLPGRITPLTRVLPGTLVCVNVEDREIYFGFDYRVIGTFVSYGNGV